MNSRGGSTPTRDQIWAEGLHRYRAGERFEELPESLHALRDAAAQSKAGNGHLDHFFEMVAGQLERGGASGGRWPCMSW